MSSVNEEFCRIQRKIAELMCLPETTDIPFIVSHFGGSTAIRLPGPDASELDICEPAQTKDVVGEGTTFDDALEDLSSKYWLAASQVTSRRAQRMMRSRALQ